jgi:ribosomal protein S18 acetylase RimI-like enzyme
MPDFVTLASDDWRKLRDIRLSALLESPHRFLGSHEREKDYSDDRWRAEFARGDWVVGDLDGTPVSLVGTTREPHTPPDQCYIEYVWVAPEHRRSGIAVSMLTAVLDRLRAAGVSTAFLWVLTGNETATRLYRKLGFVSTNWSQPLPGDPARRSEELLRLDLPGSGS